MYKVDLNSDLGESFGAYRIGCDEEVLDFVTSANVACGFHAGDPAVMNSTVLTARQKGVMIGAHPGYADLMGFGRRNMSVSKADMHDYVLYQLGALHAFLRAHGAILQHVKPHGAMYNMAAKDKALAAAICAAVKEFDKDVILLGLAGIKLIEAADEAGLRCASEVFADRAYMEDGSLVPRTQSGAMIEDENEAIARVIGMVKNGVVKAVTGKEIRVRADSICVHGDGAKALAFTKRIRTALEAEGITVAPLCSFIK